MKAVVINSFGGSEKLSIQEVPTPVPGATEIRIKTACTAVNPVDWKIREGYVERPEEELANEHEVKFAYVFVTPNSNDLRSISELFDG